MHELIKWRIHLFDGFRLERPDGQTAWLQNRKQDELLAILAVAEGRPVPRDEIAAMMWPDKSEALGYNRLTEVLVHLKRAMLDYGFDDDPVLGVRGALALNPMIRTDLVEYRGYLQQGGPMLERFQAELFLALFDRPWIDEKREAIAGELAAAGFMPQAPVEPSRSEELVTITLRREDAVAAQRLLLALYGALGKAEPLPAMERLESRPLGARVETPGGGRKP